jgi:hypothetical protein
MPPVIDEPPPAVTRFEPALQCVRQEQPAHRLRAA